MALWLLVFGTMFIEALRAARNERAQLARGGRAPSNDVYNWMRVAYPAAFAVMLLESHVRRVSGFGVVGIVDTWAPPAVFATGAAIFVVGKALKWWAIVALGPSWTFRVIVVPGVPLVTRGPYRFLRHPNYVGVVGELLGVALMTAAVVSGPLAILGFGILMKQRIAVEERALAAGGPAARNHV